MTTKQFVKEFFQAMDIVVKFIVGIGSINIAFTDVVEGNYIFIRIVLFLFGFIASTVGLLNLKQFLTNKTKEG